MQGKEAKITGSSAKYLLNADALAEFVMPNDSAAFLNTENLLKVLSKTNFY